MLASVAGVVHVCQQRREGLYQSRRQVREYVHGCDVQEPMVKDLLIKHTNRHEIIQVKLKCHCLLSLWSRNTRFLFVVSLFKESSSANCWTSSFVFGRSRVHVTAQRPVLLTLFSCFSSASPYRYWGGTSVS